MLLDDNALALACTALLDMGRRVRSGSVAVRANDTTGNVKLDSAASVHVGKVDLEVGDDAGATGRLLPTTTEELGKRVAAAGLALLVTLQALLAAAVVDLASLDMSAWPRRVLDVGQEYGQRTSLSDKTSYATRQHSVASRHHPPLATSINFSCALSSGLMSGWYFLDKRYHVSHHIHADMTYAVCTLDIRLASILCHCGFVVSFKPVVQLIAGVSGRRGKVAANHAKCQSVDWAGTVGNVPPRME